MPHQLNGMRARAAHEELELLDVSGCKALTELHVSSARLLHAVARSCRALARMELESRQVRMRVHACVSVRARGGAEPVAACVCCIPCGSGRHVL